MKKIVRDILLYIPFLVGNLFLHGICGAYEFIIDSHKVFCKYFSKNS